MILSDDGAMRGVFHPICAFDTVKSDEFDARWAFVFMLYFYVNLHVFSQHSHNSGCTIA